MSSIDERVVELQFNNGQFEKGVAQSVGTLQKLKQSLNLEASAKSLNSLERAGKNFTLHNVANNIQTVADRCSSLGVIGDQVLRRLTDKALNFGKTIATWIPNQMMSGGTKRARNIEQAKFQMEGLLGSEEFAKQWELINKNINDAVAGTAYGYDEAARVAAQLKASNIDFGDDMQKVLTGISGVAAMTNSSYSDIGHIFTTIAGQGKLMTEQLNQFAGRGLNVAAELAKALKVDEATLRQMVTKGKIDFKTFAFAMEEAFGKQAQKANKTFEGAMSNIRASFSRMGAQFLQPGYEAIRKVLVGMDEDFENEFGLLQVLKDIEKILKPLSDEFSVFAEKAAGGINDVLNKVHNFLDPFAKAGEELHKAFEEAQKTEKAATAVNNVATATNKTTKSTITLTKAEKDNIKQFGESTTLMGKMRDGLTMLHAAYEKLNGSEVNIGYNEAILSKTREKMMGSLDKIKQNLAERFPLLNQLFNLEKEENKTVKENAKEYNGLEELAADVILGKYGNGEDRKKQLEELGVAWTIVQNKVNEMMGVEKRHEVTAEDEAKTAKFFGETLDETGEKAEKTKTNLEKLLDILGGLGAAISIVREAATAIWNNILVPFGTWAGTAILGLILDLLSKIGAALVNLRNSIPEGFFDQKTKAIADFFRRLSDAFGKFVTKARNLESVQKLSDAFSRLGTAIRNLFHSGLEKLSSLFSSIDEKSKEGLNFDWALPIVNLLASAFEKLANGVSSVIESIGPIATKIGDAFGNLWKQLNDSGALTTLSTSFSGLINAISGLFSLGIDALVGKFNALGQAFSGAEKAEDALDFSGAVPVIKNVIDTISGLIDSVTNFISLITEKGGNLGAVFAELFGGGGEEGEKEFGSLQAQIDKLIDPESLKETGKNGAINIGQGIVDGLKTFFLGEEVFAADDMSRSMVPAIVEGAGSAIETVKPTLKEKVLTIISNIGKWLSEAFTGSTFKKVVRTAQFGALGFIGLKIGSFFSALGKGAKSIKSLVKPISGVLGDVSNALKAYQRDVSANTLLKVAGAIGILALALVALSFIETKKLGEVAGVLISIISVVGLFVTIITAIKSVSGSGSQVSGGGILSDFLGNLANAAGKALKIAGIGFAFAAVAAAVWLLVNAISAIAGLGNIQEVVTKTVLIGVLMAALVGVAYSTKKFAKDFDASTGAGLLMMAAAVMVLVKAMGILGSMDVGQLLQGGIALAGILTALVLVSRYMGKGNMVQFASGCLLMSVALVALSGALILYGLIPFSFLIKSLGKLMLVFAALWAITTVAGPAIIMVAESLNKFATALLKIVAAFALFGVALAVVGVGFQVFLTGMASAGVILTENFANIAKGFGAFLLVLSALIALGYLANGALPGLIGIAAVIGSLSLLLLAFSAAAVGIGAITHFFPELGEALDGAFGGVGETIKGVVEGVKSFFGESKDAIGQFTSALDSMGIRGELKEELLKRFTELTHLSGKDFSIAVDDLIAYINGLELPETEKQRILKEYIDGLEIDAQKNYGVALKDLKATVNGVDFNALGKASLYLQIQKLLDLSDESGFFAQLSDAKVFLETATLSEAAKGKIATELAQLDNKDLSPEQRRVILNGVMLYINTLNYQGEAQSAVQTAFDAVANAKGAKELQVTVEHAQAVIDNLHITDARKQELSKNLNHAVNTLTPEQRKLFLNRAYLNITNLDWDEEGKQAFIERIAELTGLDETAFKEAFAGIREELEAAGYSADVIAQIMTAAENLQKEYQDLFKIRLEQIGITIDDILLEYDGSEEDKKKIKEELEKRYEEIKNALIAGDTGRAIELATQLGIDLQGEDYSKLSPEDKKVLADQAYALVTAANEALANEVQKQTDKGGKDTSFVVGDNLFGLKAGTAVEIPIRGRIDFDGDLSANELDSIIEGLTDPLSSLTASDIMNSLEPMGLTKDQLMATLFPQTLEGVDINNLLAKDMNVEGFKQLFMVASEDAMEGYEEGFANAGDEATDEAGKQAENAIARIREVNDSHSPSIVYKGLGQDAIEGYALGIEAGQGRVDHAINAVFGGAIGRFQTIHDLLYTNLGKRAIDSYISGLSESQTPITKAISAILTGSLDDENSEVNQTINTISQLGETIAEISKNPSQSGAILGGFVTDLAQSNPQIQETIDNLGGLNAILTEINKDPANAGVIFAGFVNEIERSNPELQQTISNLSDLSSALTELQKDPSQVGSIMSQVFGVNGYSESNAEQITQDLAGMDNLFQLLYTDSSHLGEAFGTIMNNLQGDGNANVLTTFTDNINSLDGAISGVTVNSASIGTILGAALVEIEKENPEIKQSVETLTTLATSIENVSGEATDLNAVGTVLKNVLGIDDSTTENLNTAVDLFGELSKSLGITLNEDMLTNVLTSVFKDMSAEDIPKLVKETSEALRELEKVLKDYEKLDIDIAATFGPAVDAFAAFGWTLKPVTTTLFELALGMSILLTAVSKIATVFSSPEILDNFIANIPKMKEAVLELVNNLVDITPELGTAAAKILDSLMDVFENESEGLLDHFIKLVLNIVDGVTKAIMNNADGILHSFEVMLLGGVDVLLTILDKLLGDIPVIGESISKGVQNAHEEIQSIMNADTAEKDVIDYAQTVEETITQGFENAYQAVEAAAAGKGFMPASVLEKAFTISNGDFSEAMRYLQEQLSKGELTKEEIMQGIIPPDGVSSEDLMEYLFKDDGSIDPLAFRNLLVDAGAYVIEGLNDGLTENSHLCKDAIEAVSRGMEEGFDGYNGVFSPSRLYTEKGKYIVQGLANGITRSTVLAQGAVRVMAVKMLNAFMQFQSKFKAAGANAAKGLIDGFKSKTSDATRAGSSLGEALANGIKSKGSQVLANGKILAGKAIEGIENKLGKGSDEGTKGYTIGKDFGQGLINGLNSKISKIKQKAAEAGAAMDEGARSKEGANENSPSKKAIKVGEYFGEGLVIGINEFSNKVYSASANMANSAVDALQNPMSIVRDILSGDLDIDPTIRPVMDLSEIQNGVDTINAMTPAMAVGIGSISASMNRRKVDSSEEVISAINSLREGMNQPSNVYNVNGITYDDGSNISDAVRGLIRAARVERRR